MYCFNCGKQINEKDRFCPYCAVFINILSQPGPQQKTYPRSTAGYPSPAANRPEQPPAPKKKSGGKRARRVFAVLLILLIAAGIYFFFFVKTSLDTAPKVRTNRRGPGYHSPVVLNIPFSSGNSTDNPGLGTGLGRRDDTKYTFLILAVDEGGGNTDVIMTASFDTAKHKFEVVNIPRDTLSNVSWNSIKKANSIYANMRQKHGWDERSLSAGMDAVVELFADIIGYEVDYWAIVDMKAFVRLVDAIDGVDFNVPVDMHYVDEPAGLYIDYASGMQHLNGKQALEVVRFRSGYSNADIGRINTQQEFLMSAVKQIMEKRSSLNITELAKIFLKDVKTNLKLDDLIWFGNEFLKMNADSVHFQTLPANYWDSVRGQSYVTIYTDEWLKMVDEFLSPFKDATTPEKVSILTRDSGGRLYVTDGNHRGDPSWGS